MTDTAKQGLAAQLTSRVKEALDRADEVGGDLRDYLQDRWTNDPRLAPVRARLDKLRGREPVRAPARAQAAASPLADKPAPAAPAKQVGLGNPALPAQI